MPKKNPDKTLALDGGKKPLKFESREADFGFSIRGRMIEPMGRINQESLAIFGALNVFRCQNLPYGGEMIMEIALESLGQEVSEEVLDRLGRRQMDAAQMLWYYVDKEELRIRFPKIEVPGGQDFPGLKETVRLFCRVANVIYCRFFDQYDPKNKFYDGLGYGCIVR